MVAPAILAVFSLGYTVVAAGRLAQQHFAGQRQLQSDQDKTGPWHG